MKADHDLARYVLPQGVWPCDPTPRTASDDISDILKERKTQHGDFRIQFKIAQAIKRAMGAWESHVNDVQREALEQICHKLSRIVTGDPNHSDHWRDIAGYATLITNMLEGK